MGAGVWESLHRCRGPAEAAPGQVLCPPPHPPCQCPRRSPSSAWRVTSCPSPGTTRPPGTDSSTPAEPCTSCPRAWGRCRPQRHPGAARGPPSPEPSCPQGPAAAGATLFAGTALERGAGPAGAGRDRARRERARLRPSPLRPGGGRLRGEIAPGAYRGLAGAGRGPASPGRVPAGGRHRRGQPVPGSVRRGLPGAKRPLLLPHALRGRAAPSIRPAGAGTGLR